MNNLCYFWADYITVLSWRTRMTVNKTADAEVDSKMITWHTSLLCEITKSVILSSFNFIFFLIFFLLQYTPTYQLLDNLLTNQLVDRPQAERPSRQQYILRTGQHSD